MKILKELRQHHKLTQKDIAERLEVTQQTVAKWENGKSEPSIAHLRDLAVIYDTSLDELTRQDVSIDTIRHNKHHYTGKNDEFFWGHIGLGIPNQAKSIWYPITLQTANQVISSLDDSYSDFIEIDTLNNRSLFFNKKNLLHIHILDDDADYPKDDWELGWDSYYGQPDDIYPAISDYLTEGFLDPGEYSPVFIKRIEGILEKYPNLTDDDINNSKIYTLSKAYNHFIMENLFEDLRFLALDNETTWLNIGDETIGMDTFISSHQIVLIDVPTHLFNEAFQDEND